MNKPTTKVTDLKAGQFVELYHVRKGIIFGKVKSVGDEWMTLELLDRVTGLANRWEAGEELNSRNSFVTVMQVCDKAEDLKTK